MFLLKNKNLVFVKDFGTNVHIKQTKNKGKIEIEFFSKEDLERILDMLETNQEF